VDEERIGLLLRQVRDESAEAAERARAFGEIVRRYQAMAFGLAWAMLGDFQLAEDAAQEAFLSAWRHLPQLRRDGAFGGWLRKIIVRQCRRMMRVDRPPESAWDVLAEAASGGRSPAEEAEMWETRRTIRAAIRALPEKHRIALGLYYVDGYSQREVADFLGVPVGTVKSRLHAGRAMLAERILEMARTGLSEAAPGPEFTDQVRRMVGLIGAGERITALGLQETLLGQLRALQRQGRHEEVVRRHQAAMAVIAEAVAPSGMWRTIYGLLGES
jgi:RNA polymerase sigma factor (sigma-70 family)